MASNRSRFGVVTSDPFTCLSQIEGDDVSSDDDSVDVLDLEDSDTSFFLPSVLSHSKIVSIIE